MGNRVAVNGFMLAAVDCEVRLPVAVQVELAQTNATIDWFLEDSGGYGSRVPNDFAGQADIQLMLKPDPVDPNAIWLWAAADNLRIAAVTAAECAESMMATRPTGKIQ